MKTVIYFLRHGEVENPKKILYGRLPGFGLSQNGKKRIEELAGELAETHIDYIYCSPLRRARETAEIVNRKLHKKLKISRLLIEVRLIHQGMPLDTFKRDIQPTLYEDHFIKQGQESIKSQEDRMMRFVKNMQKRHSGKTILAISHGDPILVLKAKILNIPFTWEFKRLNYIQPGSYITIICENSHYQVE